MSYLVVTPLSRLAETAEKHRPQEMITLIGKTMLTERPRMVSEKRHLVLRFNDITGQQAGLVAPAHEHVTALLHFAEKWQQTAPLLIHCWMGISRSTAAAFIIACALNPAITEKRLAGRLRQNAPSATPNARLVALADKQLGRNGRMIAAIEAIGRGCEASEGSPFRLDFNQEQFSDKKRGKIKTF